MELDIGKMFADGIHQAIVESALPLFVDLFIPIYIEMLITRLLVFILTFIVIYKLSGLIFLLGFICGTNNERAFYYKTRVAIGFLLSIPISLIFQSITLNLTIAAIMFFTLFIITGIIRWLEKISS